MTSSLAVFGNLTIDDLVFPDGTTRWAVPGGNAVYAAFGMALWAGHASIVAPIGADYPMESMDERFDLSRCRRVPRTLRNWGLYEEDGTRHFVFRSAARNWKEFSPIPEDAASGYQAAAHIAPIPHDVAIELSKELRKTGPVTISLDLDDRNFVDKKDPNAMIAVFRAPDLLLPSLQDVRSMFTGAGAFEVLRELRYLAPDVALIAVKCGAEGVIAHAAGASHWVRIPAVPVELVDATGAGDAFCGGVLAGFAKQGDAMEALLCGAVSASFCVEDLGLAGLAAATRETADGRLAALRRRIGLRPM